MIKIAIVTTDYNGHDDTDEWLASSKILNTKGLKILWLVVDNGSDVSVRKTVEKYPGVVWMQTGKNLGFTGGFNRGMKYAKEWGAEFVLIINNDTLFEDPDFLQKMLQVFDKNPKAGIVSPKIYFTSEFEFYKERYKKSEKGKVIWYAGGNFEWDNIKSNHRGIDEVDSGKYNKVEKTKFNTGCCILVKREVLEKVGYFEEKLFAYFEDSDWNERIKNSGFELWYAGNTYITHKVSRTAEIGSSWSDYLITRNRMWFGMKYASARTKFALWREAFRFLIAGRPAQKEGILDFIMGVWGWKKAANTDKFDYPQELSIIIINYKTTKFTLQLLESLIKKNSGIRNISGGVEVIVLDNSPDEPCKDEVLKVYPNIKFISNKVNNGFSAGNNQMINYSLGKHILLLNSDIEVKPLAIKKLMESVYKYAGKSIYAGKLFFPTGETQDSCFLLPTAWHAFEQYFLGKTGSYFMFVPKVNKPTAVEGAVMACFLIPRKVINEIGFLQEETFMYFEDIEYSRRAKKAGIPIYYIPDAHFIHHHGQSSKKAGTDLSYARNVAAAKWYHGKLNYFLVTAVLWAGQKWNKVKTPESRWKKESE